MKSIGLGASFYDMVAVDACCELFAPQRISADVVLL